MSPIISGFSLVGGGLASGWPSLGVETVESSPKVGCGGSGVLNRSVIFEKSIFWKGLLIFVNDFVIPANGFVSPSVGLFIPPKSNVSPPIKLLSNHARYKPSNKAMMNLAILFCIPILPIIQKINENSTRNNKAYSRLMTPGGSPSNPNARLKSNLPAPNPWVSAFASHTTNKVSSKASKNLQNFFCTPFNIQ